jgi:hypothetical protein
LRHQALEFTLVLGPEDLRYYSVDQSLFLGGRQSTLRKLSSRSLAY